MAGGFKISKLTTIGIIIGIIFFMGYGVATNADHIPWNLLPWNVFENQPNSALTMNDNPSDNGQATPLNDTQNGVSNQKSDSVQSSSPNGEISSSEAKSTADKYIKDPGASSGTPQRVNVGGQDTYVVPVESNGSTVGEIHVDPNTGENVGGAGGAPTNP
ncbi:MAG: PepSY domain-containing protein [Methanobacterium sp.]